MCYGRTLDDHAETRSNSDPRRRDVTVASESGRHSFTMAADTLLHTRRRAGHGENESDY